jgi:hypothetical protein
MSPSRYDEPVEERSENEDINDMDKLETVKENDIR